VDRRKGNIPFFYVATFGTTSTCAIDPIFPLGKICEHEKIWFHIDAAYAGSACICDEFRHYLNGVEFSDSFNFNPHKWLLVNFDCSCLWIKDKVNLTSSMSINPATIPILQNAASEQGAVDFRDWQVPLGRRFRALKVWFVLRTYGVRGLQNYIRHHIKLAEDFENWLKKDTLFEIVSQRFFSLVVFKLKDRSNEFHKLLEDAIEKGGQAMISHTVVNGSYVLRFAVGATHTKHEHIENFKKLLLTEVEKLKHQP